MARYLLARLPKPIETLVAHGKWKLTAACSAVTTAAALHAGVKRADQQTVTTSGFLLAALDLGANHDRKGLLPLNNDSRSELDLLESFDRSLGKHTWKDAATPRNALLGDFYHTVDIDQNEFEYPSLLHIDRSTKVSDTVSFSANLVTVFDSIADKSPDRTISAVEVVLEIVGGQSDRAVRRLAKAGYQPARLAAEWRKQATTRVAPVATVAPKQVVMAVDVDNLGFKGSLVPPSLKVFLSHASADKPTVRELYRRLQRDGFEPWLDEEDLIAGQDWSLEIKKAVNVSDVVVLCLSKSSITKEGYIQKEMRQALELADEKPEGTVFIIPIRLDECEVPHSLKRWHWVNFFAQNGYDKLVRALSKRSGDIAGSGTLEPIRNKKTSRDTSASLEMKHQPNSQGLPPTSNSVPKFDEPAVATTHVVVLVHGIRDYALWQDSIRSALESAGLQAEPTNYDRFNLIKFLLPIWFFRRQAIENVWRQIRIIVQNNPNARISVIAHSFGTFVISHLMKEEFDIKFHRVIFCGSVVPYNFSYEQIQNRFEAPIINEVGTRDIWPAIAESVTFGYGSAGTYGFRRPLVRDRWHNGAGHGFFLNFEFCQKYWVPFLADGTITAGDSAPESPRLWLQLLSIFKVKYIGLIIVALLFTFFVFPFAEQFLHFSGPAQPTKPSSASPAGPIDQSGNGDCSSNLANITGNVRIDCKK